MVVLSVWGGRRLFNTWACVECGAVVDRKGSLRQVPPTQTSQGVELLLHWPTLRETIGVGGFLNALLIFPAAVAMQVSATVAERLGLFPEQTDHVFLVMVGGVMLLSAGVTLAVCYPLSLWVAARMLPKLLIAGDHIRWRGQALSRSEIASVEGRGRRVHIHTTAGEEHVIEPVGGTQLLLTALGEGQGIGTEADIPAMLHQREGLRER